MARIDGHVILTAEQAGLGDTGEKKDDKALFARFGYRPAGRKQIAGTVATVAHLSRDSSGQQYLTTFKDRGRELVSGVPISDFFRDYMVKVAGWKMAGSAPAPVEVSSMIRTPQAIARDDGLIVDAGQGFE
jgi:hypothetical protein